MRYRVLGDVRVGAIGYGAMPLSIEGRPDEARAVATIHAALDAGMTLLDTADSYHPPGGGPGEGELLVARALAAYGGATEDVLVATKGGRGRTADGGWTMGGRPEHLRRAAESSRRRLGVEAIGLYQLHKPDPSVPYAESLGAIRELLDAGTIRLALIHRAPPGARLPAMEPAGRDLAQLAGRRFGAGGGPGVRGVPPGGAGARGQSAAGGARLAPRAVGDRTADSGGEPAGDRTRLGGGGRTRTRPGGVGGAGRRGGYPVGGRASSQWPGPGARQAVGADVQ